MAAIQCNTEIPAIEGLKDQELTVGREFLLACEGEFPRDLQQDKLQLVLKPEHKYVLHLLGFEFRTPTVADVRVTSYVAGQFRFEDLQMTDGVQAISLGPVQLQVESVLPPPEAGQAAAPQEPYGPIGPASMAVPVLYWAILASVLGLVALLVISKVYRIIQRKNMLERLRDHDSALTPLTEFHQSFRRLQRSNTVFFGKDASRAEIEEVLVETHKMFKLFLTRQFRVPAFEWSERLVMKDIKKYHRDVYVESGEALAKLFHEYAHAFKDKAQLTSTDVLNLATHCRILVEKMERVSS